MKCFCSYLGSWVVYEVWAEGRAKRVGRGFEFARGGRRRMGKTKGFIKPKGFRVEGEGKGGRV